MDDQVSGKAAVELAFVAYESGRNTALAEPQRIRLQAASRVPVDVIVGGEITPAVLRNIARLLIANAEVLEQQPPEQPTPAVPVAAYESRKRESAAEGEAERLNKCPPLSGDGP